jgi:Tol biopolymer transport system component
VSALVIRRLLSVALCAALLYACLGPSFQIRDLPEESIALVYRTREESERRAEILARSKEKPKPRLPGQGRLRLEELGDFLGLGRTAEEKRADFLGRMALLNPRTGEVETLRFAPRGARPLCWSPDRRRLLYVAALPGASAQQVFEYDRASGEVHPIARGPYHYLGASYGPDGRFALARLDPREGATGRSRIFVTRPGGGGAQPVTPGPVDSWPVWSPDGSVVAYSSLDEAGKPVIRSVQPLSGDEPRFVTRGLEPSFSPEGDWLVYTAKRRGRWAIWRVRPDGSGKLPIGSSAQNERDPTFSPDGRFVVYVAEDKEHQRLMVRSLDGSGNRPLLGSGDGLLPVW